MKHDIGTRQRVIQINIGQRAGKLCHPRVFASDCLPVDQNEAAVPLPKELPDQNPTQKSPRPGYNNLHVNSRQR